MTNPKLLIRPEASLLLTRISQFLTRSGTRSYLVGGIVRDALLGRNTADIDIAVEGDAIETAMVLAVHLKGKYVPLDRENGVARVVMADEDSKWDIDLSTVKGNIKEDLARRDFTIDAMAVDLADYPHENYEVQLIDPFNGWGDLHQGKIRVVAETSFAEDAIRLLRAVRLAAELGFIIDSDTESMIKNNCGRINDAAGERIREELLRLLAIPQAEQIRYLDELGLLIAIIPELAQAKGVEQPKEHYWDVFNHSLQTVDAVDFILRQGEWGYKTGRLLDDLSWSIKLEEHFNQEVSHVSTRRILLKLAALLHDIAKPKTKTFDDNGRMRFFGHTQEGADMTAEILERLRFSSREVRLVEAMVKHHLRPVQMNNEGLPSRRAIYRYFRDTDEAGIDILFLSLADHLAARGPRLDLDQWRAHIGSVNYVLNQHDEQESVVIPVKLLDGCDVINIFGIAPGPEIGEILETVREAQAMGELTNKEEALSFVREYLRGKVSSHG